MPRNMSFMLTTKQIKQETKTITRRVGWWFLKPGDILNACEKCQGLQKGERIKKLCQIRVISTKRTKLCEIDISDCICEGFPNILPLEFITMFCNEMNCKSTTFVNRIEFQYI